MLLTLVRRSGVRIPAIRFRQGGSPNLTTLHSHTSQIQNAPGGKRITVSAAIIEDWQLPARFRRRLISEEECQAINLGGAI